MSTMRGDDIPVSTYLDSSDGSQPSGTAAFEKRGIAADVPVWNKDCCIQCNRCAMVCPHGVAAMSQDIPGFVETSTNLASVKIIDGEVVFTTSQRSSVESKKRAIVDKVSTTFWMIGADVENSDGYPGWNPNPNSEAVRVLTEAYRNIFHKDPQVLAIHAGLECGLFSEKYPDMDMVSFGPTLRGVHSPDEKLEIATVQMCWDLMVEFFKLLK